MSETPNIYVPVDATDFTPHTEVDLHAGNPNLVSLDAARRARKLAEEALDSQNPETLAEQRYIAIIGQAASYVAAVRAQEAA